MMETVATKGVALLFSLLMLANAFVVRRLVGTWLFPACIFALFWFGYTFLPLAILYWVPVNPWPIAYLLVLTIAFSLSALFYFDWKLAFELNRQKPEPAAYFNTPFLRALFGVAAALSLVGFSLNMRAQGFSVEDMLLNTIQTAAAYAGGRGKDELTFSIWSKIGLALAYLAATTGGLLFGCSKSWRQSALLLLGSFLPAAAEMLLESAKGLLFQCVSLFFGCILVVRLFQGRMYLIDAAGVRKGLVAFALILPLTLVSFMSRGLYAIEDNAFLASRLWSYVASYAFGHLYAFADWFSAYIGMPASLPYGTAPTGYGFYTFMAVFKTLGSTRVTPQGLFDDYFTYGELLRTNIFTMFRGLIIDFGMLGAVLFSFVTGFIFHLFYYFLLARRRPVVSVVVFIYSIGYFYSSAFASLFSWNVIPLSIVVMSLCLYANKVTTSIRRVEDVRRPEPV